MAESLHIYTIKFAKEFGAPLRAKEIKAPSPGVALLRFRGRHPGCVVFSMSREEITFKTAPEPALFQFADGGGR